MARPKSASLTAAELRLMDILWSEGPSTVSTVVEKLPEDADLAYSTVLTTLRILEDKGYLTHEKQGRAFIYKPLIEKTSAQRSAIRHLLARFFGNQPELLIQSLLDNEELSKAEIYRLKKLISSQESAQ